MDQYIFISPKISTDAYNRPTYGTSVSYSARIVFGTHLVRDKNGELVPSSGTAWIASTAYFKPEDKFEYLRDDAPSPGDYTQLFPIRIDTFPDETGMHHTRLHFK